MTTPFGLLLIVVITGRIAAIDNKSSSVEAEARNEALGGGGGGKGGYYQLRQQLLKHHDKYVHPRLDHREAVMVQLGMSLIHVDVDEMKSTVSVDAWLRMLWNNEFLKWNSSEYEGINHMILGADHLWKPDVLLYNNADVPNIEFTKTHLLLYDSGDVLWVPPVHLVAFCHLDLKYWPMDKQECKLKFGSWTQSGEKIDLALYANKTDVDKMNFFTSNKEWHIDDAKAEVGSDQYMERYPYVNIVLKLQRNSPAYRSVIILPCLILMLTTGCSFLLTPESGEKLFVSGLSLVGTLLYLIYFASTLPFHQSSVPVIVTFYSNTAGLIGIAILLNVTCLSMAREKKYSSPPKFLIYMFSGLLGKILCLGNYGRQVSSTHQRLSVELATVDNESDLCHSTQDQLDCSTGIPGLLNASHGAARHSIIMQDWILVAAGLERTFFIIYAIAFAVVTTIYI